MPLADLAFEHRMYLPLAAVVVACVLAGFVGLTRVSAAWRLPETVAAAGSIVPAGGIGVVLGFMTWHRNADYIDSTTILEDTLAKAPHNPRPYYNLGAILQERGQADAAIANYRKALERNPGFVEAHNNLGAALMGRGEIDAAVAHYEKALELKPGYAEAHNNLGLALAARGRFDAAVAHYEKALELKPGYAEAHNNLGLALAARGRLDAAVAQYEEALAIKPDYGDAYYNLGVALAKLDRMDAAVASYRKAVEFEPDSANAQSNLGNALAARGQADAAIACYQRALAIKPDHVDALNSLGLALAGLGRLDAAIAQYRKALAIKPDYAERTTTSAWPWPRAVKLRAAIAKLPQGSRVQARLRRGPKQPRQRFGGPRANPSGHRLLPEVADDQRRQRRVHYNLAAALAGIGQADEAVVHYRKAVEVQAQLRRGPQQSRRYPAEPRSDRGRRRQLPEDVGSAPDFAEAHYNLAAVLRRQGRSFRRSGRTSARGGVGRTTRPSSIAWRGCWPPRPRPKAATARWRSNWAAGRLI